MAHLAGRWLLRGRARLNLLMRRLRVVRVHRATISTTPIKARPSLQAPQVSVSPPTLTWGPLKVATERRPKAVMERRPKVAMERRLKVAMERHLKVAMERHRKVAMDFPPRAAMVEAHKAATEPKVTGRDVLLMRLPARSFR